jgi:hypothetical protein
MKKFTILILCLAATMTVSAQKRKTVTAEGPIVTNERSVESFTGITVSTGIDVYLTQGNGFKLSLKAEENLHEYIITEVKDNILHVYTKMNLKGSKSKKVYVTMEDVKSLKASSAGDIFGETVIKADKLKLKASSAGDIKLIVQAKSIVADCSSAGDIQLSGSADYLDGSTSSAGDLLAKDLKVTEAKVSASSSGDVVVNVSGKLYARASSSGDVRYYGNPEVDARSSSAGSVRRK